MVTLNICPSTKTDLGFDRDNRFYLKCVYVIFFNIIFYTCDTVTFVELS